MVIANLRKPAVTFCRSGRINVTSWVCRTLGLKPGDAINIYEDGGESYLYGIHAPGYPCKAVLKPVNKSSVDTCYCMCREICDYIAAKMGRPDNKLTVGSLTDTAVGPGLPIILRDIC